MFVVPCLRGSGRFNLMSLSATAEISATFTDFLMQGTSTFHSSSVFPSVIFPT